MGLAETFGMENARSARIVQAQPVRPFSGSSRARLRLPKSD